MGTLSKISSQTRHRGVQQGGPGERAPGTYDAELHLSCRGEEHQKVNVERYYPMKLDEEYCQGSLDIDIDIDIDIDTTWKWSMAGNSH